MCVCLCVSVCTIQGRVYTDGSCFPPTDPMLSRAAWAVAGPGTNGTRALAEQRVSGMQTIGRAELAALAWLTHCQGDFSICTDSLSFAFFVVAHLRCAPMPPKWLEGINGDMWRMIRRTDINVSWIRSHMFVDDV